MARDKKFIQSELDRLNSLFIKEQDRTLPKDLLRDHVDKAPELDFMAKYLDEYWKFKGVKTQPCEREELLLKDMCIIHGYRNNIGEHAWHNGMNTVTGHLHKGGVVYHRKGKKNYLGA